MSISIEYLSDDEKRKLFSNTEDEFLQLWNDPEVNNISQSKIIGFELNYKLFNPLLINYIIGTLNMMCWNCKKPLLKLKEEKTEVDIRPIDFKDAKRMVSTMRYGCPVCGYSPRFLAKASETSGSFVDRIYSKFNKTLIEEKISKIYEDLEKISEEDLIYFGLPSNLHPRNFFTSVICCIQKNFYTSMLTDAEGNEITTRSNKIVIGIEGLYNSRNFEMNNIEQEYTQQKFFSSMIGHSKDDSNASAQNTTFKKISTGKYSFTSELRTTVITNTGRSTIVGAPDLPYNYIGVPKRFSENLGIIIKVTQSNFQVLSLMKDCNLLINPPEVLEIGSNVKRKIMDGDVGVVTRSPILDPDSVQAYRIKLIDGPVIKLPLPMTTIMNADFDGDEVNIKVFEDPKANVEVLEHMLISNNLISGSKGIPIPKLVLNTCYGFTLILTEKNTFTIQNLIDITKGLEFSETPEEFETRYFSVLKHKPKKDGKTLLSMILPKHLHYTNNKGSISIQNGIITKFEKIDIDRKTFNGKKILNSIFTSIIANFDPIITTKFMNNIRILINNYFDVFPECISLHDFMTAYTSFRKHKGQVVDVINSDSTLLETIGYGIKGDKDNLKLLLYEFPRQKSYIYPVDNTQTPFFPSGSKLETYNIGSNLFEGLSLMELLMVGGKARLDILNSKKNVAKTGDIGNKTRSTMSSVYLNEDSEVTFNNIKLGSVVSPLFDINSTISSFDDCPVSPEFLFPSSTDSKNIIEENVSEDIEMEEYEETIE